MFCYIFSLTHHFLSYFLSSCSHPLENKKLLKMKKAFRILATPITPPPSLGIPGHLLTLTTGFRGHMFSLKILKRNSKMLCVLVLVLTKYMVQCYLLIILSSLFSKHVNLHTKNNTIVHVHIAKHTPAMGVRNHVSCEHFETLE